MREYVEEKGGFKMDISMKTGAEKLPFRILEPPDEAVLFMQQHIGKRNKPIVAKGEKVKTGQKIGDEEGHITAPIHSPITGVVTAIEEVHHPVLDTPEIAVFIRKEEDEEVLPLPAADLEKRRDIIRLVREAGIVGLGGAGFPTHVKLASEGVRTFVVNAKEGDPNIVCDVRLMIEEPENIVEGIKLMAKAMNAERTVFATRTQEGELPALEELMEEEGIEVKRVHPSYSVGYGRLLVNKILGVEIPSNKHTTDLGIVVNNVSTAHAVYKAAYKNEPLISRGLSFYSEAKGLENLWFYAGSTIQEILTQLGIDFEDFDRMVISSLMMGRAVSSPKTPLLKYSTGLTALTPKYPAPYLEQLPCIRCGYCDNVCPVSIYPSLILKAEKRGNVDALKRLSVEDCIECGLCSYVCPSHIRLTKHLWGGKRLVKNSQSVKDQQLSRLPSRV